MFKTNLLAAAATFAALLVGGTAANATVMLGYQRSQDASITTFATSGSDGVAVGSASPGQYTIVATGTGSPANPSPNLFSSSFDVRGAAGSASTLKIFVTETNVSTVAPIYKLSFSETDNSTIPVLEQVFVSQSNSAYATTTLLGSYNATPNSASNMLVTAPAGLTGPYSITFIYTATFPTTGGRLNAEIDEVAAAAVPEPMSLSLLGAGLVGIGMVRRRAKKSA